MRLFFLFNKKRLEGNFELVDIERCVYSFLLDRWFIMIFRRVRNWMSKEKSLYCWLGSCFLFYCTGCFVEGCYVYLFRYFCLGNFVYIFLFRYFWLRIFVYVCLFMYICLYSFDYVFMDVYLNCFVVFFFIFMFWKY